MEHKQQLAVGALAGAAVVGLVVAVFMWLQPAQAPIQGDAMPAQTAMPQQAPAPAPSATVVTPPTNVSPPWARPGSAGTAVGKDPNKLRELQAIQARLTALTAGGRVSDYKALDTVLADLIRVQGSAVIGGVDFTILRSNLSKAQEIERMAKEMEALSKQPKPDAAKIQSLMTQIQAAQAGLRTDVMVPPAGASAPKR